MIIWRQNSHNLQNNNNFCKGIAFSSLKISSRADELRIQPLEAWHSFSKNTLECTKDVIIYNIWEPFQFCLCVPDCQGWVYCGFSVCIFFRFWKLIWNLPLRMHIALQFAQYQDPLSDSDALQYFFCKGDIETWDLGSFRYSQPG